MGVFQNHLMGAAAAASAGGDFYSYTIDQSCRMTKSESSYLRMTQGTPTSTTTCTWSMWVKRHGPIPAGHNINNVFITLGNSGSQYVFIGFNVSTADALKQDWQTSPGAATTDAKFRDTSAWNHFVFRYDSTESTEADRYRWYLNGNQLSFASQAAISEDASFSQLGSGNYIGHGYLSWAQGADVYLAEVHFCDGQSYAPSQFGETKNGVWIPKDPSSLTFGDNGFHLKFENSADLGNDSSGNNNDFTATGLGADHQVLDSPTFGS